MIINTPHKRKSHQKKLRRLAQGAEKLFVTMTAVAESTFKIPYYYPEVLPLTLS